MSAWLPMFPLQSVLFPSAVLPRHVFEPRYRELTRRALDGNREFGVTLIGFLRGDRFDVVFDGISPYELWNGHVFRLRRAEGAPRQGRPASAGALR